MYTYGICMEGNEASFADAVAASWRSDFRFVEIGMATAQTTRGIIDQVATLGSAWRGFTFDLPDGWSMNLEQATTNLGQAIGDVVLTPGQPLNGQDGKVQVVLQSAAAVLNGPDWTQTIDFAFIDGCHGAACVMQDFAAVAQHARIGAHIVFHDTTPSCQGIHLQPHCGTPIAVRAALNTLGLYTNAVPGWLFVTETTAPHGIAIFRKVA